MALTFVAGFATISSAAITGTDHDFSPQSYTTEICNVCHTPHNADTSVTDAPLWDHEITAAAYTVYSSATLDATVDNPPTGISKLCLSCHDGTVAIDSFAGATGTSFVTGAALVGTDLSDDHPISFTYNNALATTDGELEAPSTASSGLGGTIDADMLFSGKLECASCHDVHDDTISPFLRKTNVSSALCLTCHQK